LSDEKSGLIAEDAREVVPASTELTRTSYALGNEIRQKLVLTTSAEVIEDVLSRLRRSGLVNDHQFARPGRKPH
jgi:hypothetical protein